MEDQAPPTPRHFLRSLRRKWFSWVKGEHLGDELTPDTEFTVKKQWWSKLFTIHVHLPSGTKILDMGPVNDFAAMLEKDSSCSVRWEGLNPTEVNFLRTVLWDIHNFEKALEPGYKKVLDCLDDIEGQPMPSNGLVFVGPPGRRRGGAAGVQSSPGMGVSSGSKNRPAHHPV